MVAHDAGTILAHRSHLERGGSIALNPAGVPVPRLVMWTDAALVHKYTQPIEFITFFDLTQKK
jgi:hypothetical protein